MEKAEEWLASVLSPILFNIYTNDQPIHDDLCVTAQYSSFTEVNIEVVSEVDCVEHSFFLECGEFQGV